MDTHQRLLQFVDGHMSIVLADFADDKFGDVYVNICLERDQYSGTCPYNQSDLSALSLTISFAALSRLIH